VLDCDCRLNRWARPALPRRIWQRRQQRRNVRLAELRQCVGIFRQHAGSECCLALLQRDDAFLDAAGADQLERDS